MSFAINGKPVKDLTDDELRAAEENVRADVAAAAQDMQRAIGHHTMVSAMLGIVHFEKHRRANAITIAGRLP